MTNRSHRPQLHSSPGVTVVEYAILLGLVAIVGSAGLMILGGSVNDLFDTGQGKGTPHNTMSLLNSVQSGKSAGGAIPAAGQSKMALTGSGYYAMTIDPTTGLSQLTMIEGSTGVPVNVNSVDGSTRRYNALGTTMLAKKLDELAAQQTDQAAKDYYESLAKVAYYIGGAEGAMDNVPHLSGGDVMWGIPIGNGNLQTYTQGDGLRDIYSYTAHLRDLISSPPPNIDAAKLNDVMPYALDVLNIGQNYLNTYDRFIDDDGTVPKNFANPNNCTSTPPYGCSIGHGPGASLAGAAEVTTTSPYLHQMIGKTYEELVPYETLKAKQDMVLAEGQVSSVPVVATIVDAKVVDSKSK